MEILLKRSRSAGSVKRGILVAVVLINVNTAGKKGHKSDGCWMKLPEKAPGFKRDRSLSADRKKKAEKREEHPHTNWENKLQAFSFLRGLPTIHSSLK